MLSLGPHKLSPTSLKYSKENHWSTIECVGKMPLLQNIGQGAENIDLEGIIYPNYFNKLDQYYFNKLDQLKNTKESGEHHTLVDSSGNVFGQFVIIRLEEKQTYFLPNGLPKKVEFSLSLKRYS